MKTDAERKLIKQAADRAYRLENKERLKKYHSDRHAKAKESPPLTSSRLKEILHYDEITGQFTYVVSRGKFKSGDPAGTLLEDGRIDIHIDYKVNRAHRLAWLYVTGEWPKNEIDHKDGNPSNNAFSNLRDVTSTVNKQNQKVAKAGKKYSALLGAQWCKQSQKWKSSIKSCGKIIHIGFFDSEQAAHEGYVKAKRELHEGCTI